MLEAQSQPKTTDQNQGCWKIHIRYGILSVRTGVGSRGDVPAGPRSAEHDEMRLLRDPRAGPPVELQGAGELL
ncbi:hypothetical protein CH306_17680 [Rhodococcus sp. 15-725-2-2b]|nr:hypothetical protein CH276_15375 [Rhodococcus sp. 06-470-2]OZC64512.1 hypothetical protein CH277_17585 [Rhodococcus sp. 06-469-3-2]OZD51145.1 hypothetical protein CH264_02220 [Rhodococcus sp. 06-1477-1A]OZE32157.1 hypothetical protein CH278_15120 [Rhodococcus sp. 05-2254-5]OZE58119.1 hypothetical protein CH265_22965 [Rhodococcus sp. 05-2221-1B]OZE59580.1 hypothetical protein CH269_06905 [Rhodococcus sp. 05-2254-1]OZE71584.1 hypothetical protein CH306_17680 [Rhodococcus sp. 15-725-2-2b]